MTQFLIQYNFSAHHGILPLIIKLSDQHLTIKFIKTKPLITHNQCIIILNIFTVYMSRPKCIFGLVMNTLLGLFGNSIYFDRSFGLD